MECNKDEATRAKEIAESKLMQKDYVGAKKLALRAQTLYPGLSGISQLLAALDVYLSAENKIRGVVDWYQVLGVDPSADTRTIKTQYRKLALMLHPDKNGSVGSHGAFQLISEAWTILEDDEKRTVFNQRIGYAGIQLRVPAHNGGPPAPRMPHQHNVPAHSGSQSVPPRTSQQKVPAAPPRRSQKKGPSAPPRQSQQKVPAHAGGPSAPPQPSQPKYPAHTGGPSILPRTSQQNHEVRSTFWTMCPGCNIYFEHRKEFLNRALLCTICHEQFLAEEKALPTQSSKPGRSVPCRRQQRPVKKIPTQNAYDPKGNVAAAQEPGAGQATPNSFPTTEEKPGNVVPQAHGHLKRSHTESHGSAGWDGCLKKGKLDDNNIPQGNSDLRTESANGTGTCEFSGTHTNAQSSKQYQSADISRNPKVSDA